MQTYLWCVGKNVTIEIRDDTHSISVLDFTTTASFNTILYLVTKILQVKNTLLYCI